jgi:hypothetical protein
MQKFYLLLVLIFLSFISKAQTVYEASANPQWLPGFSKEIKGEHISYQSIYAGYNEALLVRSKDASNFIEWETAAFPEYFSYDTAVFVMAAGTDITEDSHPFAFYINGNQEFVFSNPSNDTKKYFSINGLSGSRLEFTQIEFDKYNDFTGLILLHIPVKNLKKGKTVTIRVAGQTAGSQSWFMVFKKPLQSEISLKRDYACLKKNSLHKQSVELTFVHMGTSQSASVLFGKTQKTINLHLGKNKIIVLDSLLSLDNSVTEIPLKITIGNKIVLDTAIQKVALKPMTIYLMPHSHVDIGYTAIQTDVEKKQWKNLDEAIQIAEAHQDFPKEAQYKWNVEVMWAVESYLRNADTKKRNKLIEAIKSGTIELDGLYDNALTGLCSPEEMLRLTEYARRYSREFGVPLQTAMISDIPGWSEALVVTLTKSNIHYLSCGINCFDRVGHIRLLGDKPFYWLSPAGNEKVLCWVHNKGYHSFHAISNLDVSPDYALIESVIFNALEEAQTQGYPYDILPLRYNVGGDNGGPDKFLCERVKQWNQDFDSIKLVISTGNEFFSAFEKKYGDQLPQKKGDITPYWEDGAISSAEQTAQNRNNTDRLTQSMKLYAQYIPEKCPNDAFENAWRNVMLYTEHTWGAWNSISDPESDFTRQQWAIKKSYIDSTSAYSGILYEDVLSFLSTKSETNFFDVMNTQSFAWSDLVEIPAILVQKFSKGFELFDVSNAKIPIQKLSDLRVVFVAKNIPAFGSARYQLKPRKMAEVPSEQAIYDVVDKISNEFLSVTLNQSNGNISSIYDLKNQVEYVNQNKIEGANAYIYQFSRDWNDLSFVKENKLKLKESGSVLTTILAESQADGCDKIQREITLVNGLNRVYLLNTLDKQKIYSPEAVHFAFAFNLTNPEVKIENAFGIYSPEKEQMTAANKNYVVVNNFADISDQTNGLTLVSPDAPLMEIGKITNDPRQDLWLKNTSSSATIYSYVMNNFWHTNYCATQSGRSSYRYILFPHTLFNAAESYNNAVACEQPLIAVPVSSGAEALKPVISFVNPNVSIIAMNVTDAGKAVWAALYNPSSSEQTLEIILNDRGKNVYLSDINFNTIQQSLQLRIAPFDVAFVKVLLK